MAMTTVYGSEKMTVWRAEIRYEIVTNSDSVTVNYTAYVNHRRSEGSNRNYNMTVTLTGQTSQTGTLEKKERAGNKSYEICNGSWTVPRTNADQTLTLDCALGSTNPATSAVSTLSGAGTAVTISVPKLDMSIYLKVGGTWVQSDSIKVKVGGSWVNADAVYVKVGGEWLQ